MGETKSIPINKIIVTEENPRQTFDRDSLMRLGESIKTHGLVQPIVVRPKENYYELVVGERRLRAVELMGMKEIDARIEEIDDATLMEIRIIENTQREDLTNAEKGDAVYTLWERFPDKYPTIKSVAKAINVPYGTVQTWCAKSQKLSEKVRDFIARNELTERAAQLLLKYDHETQERLANAIIKYDIRGGREGAERRFIRFYDEKPKADLRELAYKAKGIETVRVPLEELSKKAREEVEQILEEKEREAKERRKEGRKKARRVPQRKRPKRLELEETIHLTDAVLVKAEEITEKLAELEPKKREEMATAIVRRLDTLAKSVDKETLEWIEKWKSDIAPRMKEEAPERLAMKLEEILHGTWIQIWVEYPQSVKEVARKQMTRSFSIERLERLQKTITVTVNELDDFNGLIESELFTRRHKVR